MKYTSAEAGRLVKKMEAELKDLLQVDRNTAIFRAAHGEDIEVLRPEYDFWQTQNEIEALEKKIRIAKHAINVFNVTHEVPGFEGITIDQALVMLPRLQTDKERLRSMANRLPRERAENVWRSTIIDYTIANYDIKQAKKLYRDVTDRIDALQLALNEINMSETMDIDISL